MPAGDTALLWKVSLILTPPTNFLLKDFFSLFFFPVLFRYNWLVALCKLCSIDLTYIYFVEEFFIWTSSLVSQTVKNVPARQKT